jgi:MFS family permease
VGGVSATPIVVLFGHTFLDAFDRNGFNIILPEAQEHFDLDLQETTSLAGLAIFVGILLSLPVTLWSDRGGKRIFYLALGAFLAAAFSLGASVATTVGIFAFARAGFGFGLIVNDPVQQSLLSDFTPVAARASVFSGRQIADNLGAVFGPLAFGLLAFAFGFRAPLVLVAVLALVVGLLSIRLREPRKGAMERASLGMTGADLDVDDETLGFRPAWQSLWSIGTVRLLWMSIPFLFGGVLVVLIAVPLYLEEEFDFSAADRGILGATMGAVAIAGLFVGTALTKRYLFSPEPWRMFRLMAGIGVAVAVGILYLAVVPNVALMVLGAVFLNTLSALILPAYGTLFSITFPAPARSVGFALTRLWALPGLVMAPIVGAVGDEHGMRWGIALSVPTFIIGSLIVGTGGKGFVADMAKAHEASLAVIQARSGDGSSSGATDPEPEPTPVD